MTDFSYIKDNSLIISFIYPLKMTEHVQSPKNIAAGIAQFGGLLAALRVLMIVMNMINRRQFERKVTKFLKKEKANAEELQESSSPIDSTRAGDIYRRKTFNIQDDEESMISDSLLNKSTTFSQQGLLTADEGEIRKRYSIEMFEEII
jgi:hypothetical protein